MLIKYSGKYVKIYFNMKITYEYIVTGVTREEEVFMKERRFVNCLLYFNMSSILNKYENWQEA